MSRVFPAMALVLFGLCTELALAFWLEPKLQRWLGR